MVKNNIDKLYTRGGGGYNMVWGIAYNAFFALVAQLDRAQDF